MTREEAEATLADIRRGVEQGWHAVRSNPGTWSAALQRAEHALRAFGPMLEALEREDAFHRGHIHGHRPYCLECATAAMTQSALALARTETT